MSGSGISQLAKPSLIFCTFQGTTLQPLQRAYDLCKPRPNHRSTPQSKLQTRTQTIFKSLLKTRQNRNKITLQHKHPRVQLPRRGNMRSSPWEDPPPCNSGIIGIKEDPNIILIIHYSHYYWVGGPLKAARCKRLWSSYAPLQPYIKHPPSQNQLLTHIIPRMPFRFRVLGLS